MDAQEAVQRLENLYSGINISIEDKRAIRAAIEALRGNPCALCVYSPPTAGDGRPCVGCPAVGRF